MVHNDAVYARTLLCWKLTLAHSGRALGHLKSALLLTVASAAMGLAWLCCWLECYLSGRRATSWLLPLQQANQPSPMPEAHPTLARVHPFAMPNAAPRTIDGLLRTRSAAARMEERGSSPMTH